MRYMSGWLSASLSANGSNRKHLTILTDGLSDIDHYLALALERRIESFSYLARGVNSWRISGSIG